MGSEVAAGARNGRTLRGVHHRWMVADKTMKTCLHAAACSVVVAIPLMCAASASAMIPLPVQDSSEMAGTVNHGDVAEPVFCWQYIGPNYVGTRWHFQKVAAAGTDTSDPGAGKVDGDLVIVTGGTGNSLNSYWQPAANFPNGTNGAWTASPIATSDAAYSAPWVTQVGHDALVTVQGPEHSLDAYVSSNDGAEWSMEQVAGPESTYATPEGAQVDGAAMIAAEGPNQKLFVYTQVPDTTIWQKELVANNGTINTPTIAQIAKSAVVAVEGPNNTLNTYTQTAGSSNWTVKAVGPAGSATTHPSLTAVNVDGAAITVGGPDKSLLTWTKAPGSPWQSDPMPVKGAGPKESFHAPTITQIGHYLAIAFQGPDYELSLYWQSIGSTTWQLIPIN
jgi:hypothetical protein